LYIEVFDISNVTRSERKHKLRSSYELALVKRDVAYRETYH
jgi:hypothetical protein